MWQGATKGVLPTRLPSAKVACHPLAGCCRLGRFHPFGGFSKRSRSLWERLFLFYSKNSTRRIRLPSSPGSNSPREPLDEVTTRSEAAQVILHRMLKEVRHSITLPFVKRNRGRKPPPRGNWHPASNKKQSPLCPQAERTPSRCLVQSDGHRLVLLGHCHLVLAEQPTQCQAEILVCLDLCSLLQVLGSHCTILVQGCPYGTSQSSNFLVHSDSF